MPKKLQDQPTPAPLEMPATPLEQRLAFMYISVLGVDQVGRHDDYFQLGGDSLQAIWLLTMIQESFNVQVPVAAISNQLTVARLASLITQLQAMDHNKDGETEGTLS